MSYPQAMALATLPLLSHQQLRHLVPGLSPAAARRMYQDPHDKHWQAFSHNRVDQLRLNSRVSPSSRRRKLHRNRQRWPLEDHDGRELAADPAVALPGDRNSNRTNKQPRLEREEAFRAPPKLASWLRPTDYVDDDADLYRLGLLYDDEHARGSGFGLDTIVRAAPAYSVRPAKRARRSIPPEVADAELSLSLVLDLSCSSEGPGVEQIMAPDIDEVSVPAQDGDEGAGRAGGDEDAVASLTVIYEISEGSSTHSLESEAPVDITSFPSLISGLGDGNDWALLDRTEAETGTSSIADAEVDASTGAEDGAMSAAGDPWIMLGDDS